MIKQLNFWSLQSNIPYLSPVDIGLRVADDLAVKRGGFSDINHDISHLYAELRGDFADLGRVFGDRDDTAALHHTELVKGADGVRAGVLKEHLGDHEEWLLLEGGDLEVTRRLDLDALTEPLDLRRGEACEVNFKPAGWVGGRK